MAELAEEAAEAVEDLEWELEAVSAAEEMTELFDELEESAELVQAEGESGEESQILLTIQEGRFHQVKRMFEARGKKVVYLKRISMGPLVLDESLKIGDYRELTEKEMTVLFELDGTPEVQK